MARTKRTITTGSDLSRRSVLGALIPLGAASLLGFSSGSLAAVDAAIPSYFPRTAEGSVEEMVRVAHFDVDRVKAILDARPTLANAAWDWGFGDWESALGAASHMGRRDIAEVLLAAGARPDIFAHAMLGHLDALRVIVAARPGVQRTLGPHGITLLAHARAGGEPAADVVRWLEGLADADRGAESRALTRPLAAYLGTFAYGSTPAERFQIVDWNGLPAFLREGGFPRGLFHLGNDRFHPVGAPAVLVEVGFAGERAQSITIRDAELLLTARRVG